MVPPGTGDPEIVWEDGRSDFDALFVFAWMHPGMTVHYPFTNSYPLGKRLITSTEFYKLSAVSCFSCFILIGLELCIHYRHSIDSNDRHPFSELQYSESSSLDSRSEESNRRVFGKVASRTADLILLSEALRDFNEMLLKVNISQHEWRSSESVGCTNDRLMGHRIKCFAHVDEGEVQPLLLLPLLLYDCFD